MSGSRNPLYDRIAAMAPGEKVVLVHGVDYHCDPETQRTNIHHAMRRRGVLCLTVRHNRHITVTIRQKEQ